MINPNNLCMGCMKEISNSKGRCPECGFSISDYNQMRSDRALPPMTILAGKYLLGKVLGEGGFGITYLAWDLNREEKIAIKECFPVGLVYRDTKNSDHEYVTTVRGTEDSYYKKALESFALEAENLRKFNRNPGIVSVRDFFYENNTAYITMEYVEGKTLRQVLKENGGTLPWKEVLEIMLPILDALSYVHNYRIIHRDISPENIILDKKGNATLIDFGAARIQTGNDTRSLSIILKHGYAPFEQYQSRGSQGAWTDVYAICATMYHLIGGEIPISATDRVLGDSLKTLKTMNNDVPAHISDAIEKGMAIKKEDRFQNIQELKEILYAVEEGSTQPYKTTAISTYQEDRRYDGTLYGKRTSYNTGEDVRELPEDDLKNKGVFGEIFSEKQYRFFMLIIILIFLSCFGYGWIMEKKGSDPGNFSGKEGISIEEKEELKYRLHELE